MDTTPIFVQESGFFLERDRYRVSFSAAIISIAYLFLKLLSRAYESAGHPENSVSVFLFQGFIHFHRHGIFSRKGFGAAFIFSVGTLDV